MLNEAKVKEMIEAGVEGATAHVQDYTGGGDHYSAVVVSDAFEGLSKVKQHQLVYAALGDAMKGPVHALALETLTPQQYEQRQAEA